MNVYKGGIPEHGFQTNLTEMASLESPVNPDCNCEMASPKKVELGSTDSSGATGKDVNPPAEGEVRIESRKEIQNNQPSK